MNNIEIAKTIAKSILEIVGGSDNIIDFEHCATRLRIILKDNALLDPEKAKNLKHIKGYFFQSGQHQFIIGTGIVNDAFKQLKLLTGDQVTNFKKDAYANLSPLQKSVRVLADILIPLIPVLVTTGLLMGVRGMLLELGLDLNQGILSVFQMLTDTAFAFLPVLIAYSATKRFGGTPMLGIVVGLMMVAPQLPNAWAVANGGATPLLLPIFGLKLALVGYQGSVLPAIFAGWIVSKLELRLRKIIPSIMDLILTPFLTITLSILLILLIIGPALQFIEHSVTGAILIFLNLPFGLGYAFFGAIQQLIVITGLHHAIGVIEINLLADGGSNVIQPLTTASMAGQFGAAIAVATLLKDKIKRANAFSASMSTLFGITEPLLFGVNLQYGKVFMWGMIGGAVGGMATYLLHVAPQGMGITFIPGMLLYTKSIWAISGYLLVIIASFSTSFILTRLFTRIE